MEEDSSPVTALEGLKLLCDGTYGLLITAAVVPQHINELPCRVVALPDFTIEVGLSYVITKGSPYRSLINWK